jgi:hypothetical protein
MAKDWTKLLHLAQGTAAASAKDLPSPPSMPDGGATPESPELRNDSLLKLRFTVRAPLVGRVL